MTAARAAEYALDPAPRWLVSAWNVLSVVPAGHGGGRDDRRVVCSTLLAVSCAYVVYMTPQMVCLLQRDCGASVYHAVESVFPRSMAVSCLASRLVALLDGCGAGGRTAAGYERGVAGYRALRPVARAEADGLARFARRVVLAGALLAVPLNALRVWTLMASGVPGPVVAAFVLMYAQNLSTFFVEAHFAALCHALCRMFAAVNRDLAAVKRDEVARNRYPAALAARPAARRGRPLPAAAAARLRRLKTLHGLAGDAVDGLNRAFGVHVGLSLSALSLYFMLDVYFNMLGAWNEYVKWDLMFYGWILQYMTRFSVIVVLAHVTVEQANESKILLTDINNRFLDKNTKEELQLFLNQVNSRTIHFTANDFFTVNIHLIVSVLVLGTTYLVILFQLNSTNI